MRECSFKGKSSFQVQMIPYWFLSSEKKNIIRKVVTSWQFVPGLVYSSYREWCKIVSWEDPYGSVPKHRMYRFLWNRWKYFNRKTRYKAC